MRGLFLNDLGACFCAPFKIKCIDPVTTAAAISAGASLLNGGINSVTSANMNQASIDYDWIKTQDLMYFNDEQAEKARQGQRDLLKLEQDWNESMYNQYNSPSALMRQYREAGLNPYLLSSHGLQGQNLGSPTAPVTAQATAPSTGQPPRFMPDLSGIGRAGQYFLEAASVKANVANQSASTVNQAIQNYIKMSEINVPKEERDKYLRDQLSLAYGSTFDADRFINSIDLDNEQKRITNDFKALQLSIESEFGRTERADKIMNMEQQFAVMAADIGRMAVQNKLDEASIDRMASEIVRNFAAAGLDNANADLIRRSMEFLVNTAQYEARSAWFDQANKEGQYNINKPKYEAAASELGQTVEVVDYYTDKVVDKASKLMKVNIGFDRHSSKTYFESQNKNWNVRSNFDYKHGITAP